MNSYLSPFPRHKSNSEVLKKSYATTYDGLHTYIDIPPTVTATYMKRNPFYFDLKRSTKVKGKKSSVRSQSGCTGYTVFDNKRLDKILNSTKETYILSRPKLNPACEKMSPAEKKPLLTNQGIRALTQAEALAIINKMKLPEPKGTIPKYINEFKIRDFIEKEYERLVEDEKHYPRGTFKLWEGDRVMILQSLYLVKEELMKKLCAFPVNYYLRSIKITQARSIVEKRLDEVEFAIKIFELTNVFLKL